MLRKYRYVVVSGSRDWEDSRPIFRSLFNELRIAEEYGQGLFVCVGDCPTGADHFVKFWLTGSSLPVQKLSYQFYRADWKKYGKYAGPKRNKDMVYSRNYDAALIFNKNNSRGTVNTRSLCEKRGIKILEWYVVDDIEEEF